MDFAFNQVQILANGFTEYGCTEFKKLEPPALKFLGTLKHEISCLPGRLPWGVPGWLPGSLAPCSSSLAPWFLGVLAQERGKRSRERMQRIQILEARNAQDCSHRAFLKGGGEGRAKDFGSQA